MTRADSTSPQHMLQHSVKAPVETPGEPKAHQRKSTSKVRVHAQKHSSSLAIGAAIAFMIGMMVVVIPATGILGTLKPLTCSDCSTATALDDVDPDGPHVSVSYASVTFLLKDAAAAEAFISNPEEMLSTATKAAVLWSNPNYWLGVSAAELCSCE